MLEKATPTAQGEGQKGYNMKYSYRFDSYDFNSDPYLRNIAPGSRVLVAYRENISTGDGKWVLKPQHAETGHPGNLDPSVRKFHGWRGTSNNVSVTAHGVYSVHSVVANGGEITVKLNRTDLKKDED